MNQLTKWLDDLQRASNVVGESKVLRVSCDCGGVDVQLDMADFRRLMSRQGIRLARWNGVEVTSRTGTMSFLATHWTPATKQMPEPPKG